MGIRYKDGYSADVEGFFVVGHQRIRLAKTNGCTFSLAESDSEIPPRTEGDLVVIVDGNVSSRRVEIEGVIRGQTIVRYKVSAPF
jgi:hypothetical protein